MIYDSVIWLSNLELFLSSDLAILDYQTAIYDTYWAAPHINNWLDTNRVQDNAQNTAIITKIYTLLTIVMNFELIKSTHPILNTLALTTKRVRKVMIYL